MPDIKELRSNPNPQRCFSQLYCNTGDFINILNARESMNLGTHPLVAKERTLKNVVVETMQQYGKGYGKMLTKKKKTTKFWCVIRLRLCENRRVGMNRKEIVEIIVPGIDILGVECGGFSSHF